MILNLKITNFIRLKIFQIDLFGFNLLKQFYSFISKSPFMDIALLCNKPSNYTALTAIKPLRPIAKA